MRSRGRGLALRLFGPPNIEKLKKKRDVAGLVKALSNSDPTVRRDAVKVLEEIDNPVATQQLAFWRDAEAARTREAANARRREQRRERQLATRKTENALLRIEALLSGWHRVQDAEVKLAAAEAELTRIAQQYGSLAIQPLLERIARYEATLRAREDDARRYQWQIERGYDPGEINSCKSQRRRGHGSGSESPGRDWRPPSFGSSASPL